MIRQELCSFSSCWPGSSSAAVGHDRYVIGLDHDAFAGTFFGGFEDGIDLVVGYSGNATGAVRAIAFSGVEEDARALTVSAVSL